MGNFLKKYFFPHAKNDHRPHFLRVKNLLIIAIFAISIEFIFFLQTLIITPFNQYLASILPNVLIDETNAQRQTEKLNPLQINALLEEAAQAKANDMAKKGYFAHTSPDGITPWYWIEKAGYKFSYAGENLAVNFSDSQDVINAWLASVSHRENILSNHFTDIGIATAMGKYKGRNAIFVVQMFGSQAASLNTANKPIESPQHTLAIRPNTPTKPEVKGVQVVTQRKSASFIEEVLANPKQVIQWIFLFIAAQTIIALILKLLNRSHFPNHDLISNGVLMLAIISGALVLNQGIILLNASVM